MEERYQDIACRLIDKEWELSHSLFGRSKVERYRLEHEKEYQEFYEKIRTSLKKEYFDEIYFGDYYYGAKMNCPSLYSRINFGEIKSKINEIIDSKDVLFYLQLYINDLSSRWPSREENGDIVKIPYLTFSAFFQFEILETIEKMYPFC